VQTNSADEDGLWGGAPYPSPAESVWGVGSVVGREAPAANDFRALKTTFLALNM